MAYATLSSLPPIYGLYASTIAGYVYTLFGTSGQLTIGPVALVRTYVPRRGLDGGVVGGSRSTSQTHTHNPSTPLPQVSLFMSETYTKLGIPLVSKDADPELNAQAQYHTYVRCELAAVISFAAAVRAHAFIYVWASIARHRRLTHSTAIAIHRSCFCPWPSSGSAP